MSERKPLQPKQLFSIGLGLFLVAIVGFQTWYMIDMKRQLDVIQDKRDTIASTINSGSLASTDNVAVTQAPSSPGTKQPSVADQRQKSVNAQTPPDQQAQSLPVNPPSLFDDVLNQPLATQGWDPYAEIERVRREMATAMNNAFSRFNSNADFQPLFQDSAATPEMDVQEDAAKYSVRVKVPGADEKKLSVNLDGQQLTVKGEQDVNQQKKDDMGNVIFQQRHSATFQRSITLPEPVKQNGMHTQVTNGVLTITIPKVS